MEDKKESRKNLITMVIAIAINLVIVGVIAFLEFGTDVRSAPAVFLEDIRLGWLLVALLCFGLALYMDFLKYRKMLMASEGTDDPRGALEVAILGKYYDNITPLGAGGQPFQMYYLKKRGFSPGTAGALPVTGFLTQQFAYVFVALVVFILNPGAASASPVIKAGAYIGIVFYSAVPMAVVLFAFVPHVFKKIVGAVTRLLGRIGILKDSAGAEASVYSVLDEYTTSLKGMSARPHFMPKLLFYSVIYQVAIMSIPFFVLLAFGGTTDWWTVFSLVVYIYAAITIIPTPGNSGAAEGSFYAVFASLEGGFLFWAMLVWRGLVYYSWLILGIAVLFLRKFRFKKPKKVPPQDGKLKVLLVNDLFYPAVDGVVRTVDAYATELGRRGDDVKVAAPQGVKGYVDKLPYEVMRTPALTIGGFAFRIPMPFLPDGAMDTMRREGVDVIHAHSPFMLGHMALRLGKKLRAPVVATFHSKFYDDALNTTHSKWAANLVMNYVVDFFSKADEVWACSESTAETLRSYGFHGAIRIMENGVNPPPEGDWEEMAAAARREYLIPEGAPVILFVGQQIWHKNLRLVLDTLRLIKARGTAFTAVIAGKGYDGDAIREYCTQLELDDRVKFVGEVEDRALLFGLYRLADVFFFPSAYDNAPLVLREAAQAGTPALLARGTNAAEPVEDGVNGYLAKPEAEAMANRLTYILSDPERERIGEEAQLTIPQGWDKIVARAEEAYRDIWVK